MIFASINTVLSDEEVADELADELADEELLVEATYKPDTGCETVSQFGNTVTIQYTGWLSNGKQFESRLIDCID